MIVNKFRELLKEPSIVGVNVNDDSLLQVHAGILKNKVLLGSIFLILINSFTFFTHVPLLSFKLTLDFWLIILISLPNCNPFGSKKPPLKSEKEEKNNEEINNILKILLVEIPAAFIAVTSFATKSFAILEKEPIKQANGRTS